MGGVKAVYATALDRSEFVVAVLAISTPRFHHAHLATRPAFVEDYGRAVELVDAGQGGTLVRMREPLPLLLTASGVLAKYGPHDEYDIVRHLSSLTVPSLYVLGTESVHTSAAFETLPADLDGLVTRCSNLSVEIVDGANTVYSTCPEAPFERAWAWLGRRDK